MLGRRGPVQAAFTPPELQELGELAGADVDRRSGRPRARPGERGGARARSRASAAQRRAAARVRRARAARASRGASCCASSSRRSRSSATAGSRRSRSCATSSSTDGRPHRRAGRPARRETIPCGLVLRSVGYQGVALPGVPFDERRGTIPNDAGRVRGAERALLRRLDQARAERRDRDEQEGRHRDGRAAARGRPRGPARRRRAAGDLGECCSSERGARRRYDGWQAIDAARARRRRAARPAARQARPRWERPAGDGPAGTVLIVSERLQQRELWGAETRKAIANFPVSGEPIPVPVARWLGRIKASAARVNARARPARRRQGRAHRRRRRPRRGGRARRPVPDRRLPDGVGHVVEHERERGDRQRWPGTTSMRTTT